jgi:hypothetical protein
MKGFELRDWKLLHACGERWKPALVRRLRMFGRRPRPSKPWAAGVVWDSVWEVMYQGRAVSDRLFGAPVNQEGAEGRQPVRRGRKTLLAHGSAKKFGSDVAESERTRQKRNLNQELWKSCIRFWPSCHVSGEAARTGGLG